MIVRKLGKEWGAAHAEAQPIEVSHFEAQFEVFVTERHELCVMLPTNARIEWEGNGFKVILPSD